MAIKIMVNCGHGKSTDGSWDPGCTYNGYNEAALMLPITKAAVKYLRASGFTVYSDADTNNNKNMIADVNWSNTIKDLKAYISLHCDWYKADSGVYPLYVSSGGKKLATALNSAIKSGMSMPSRGLGKRTDLWELNGTNAIACILETGAIKADLQKLKKADKYGKCIAKGVCNYFGVAFKESSEPPVQTITVKNVGYTIKTNGIVPIYNDYMGTKKSTCNGVFTLVAESSNGYGKLKSGAGWVKLSDASRYEIKKKTKIEEFCAELIREEPIIMSKMKYSNSDGECHTFDDALKYKKCNCAKYISYALQEVGLLPKGMTFYWYKTKTLKPAKAKEYFLNSKDWKVTYPNRVMKKSELKVGDIVGWHSLTSQHTTAICGVDKDGNFIWASGGSADMKNGMVKVRPNFDKHVVNVHIRYIGE